VNGLFWDVVWLAGMCIVVSVAAMIVVAVIVGVREVVTGERRKRRQR